MRSRLRLLFLVPLAVVAGCATRYADADADPSEQPSSETLAPRASEDAATPALKPHAATATADAMDAAAPPLAVAPSSIAFSWNRVSPTATYSFDVLRKSADWTAPCVGVTTIGRDLTLTFGGNCVTAELTVHMEDIQDFRICSAEKDDWSNAICTRASWDGSSSTVAFDNHE